jgi:hypothetical protein
MIKNYFKTIFPLITFLFILGCANDDEIDDSCLTVDLPNQNLSIIVIDSAGNNLIGKNSFYHPDSIELFKNKFEYDFNISSENSLNINYENFSNNDTLFLKLNDTQTDTLNFNFTFIDTKCYDYLKINSLYQNGNEIFINQQEISYTLNK